jgi:hypothetical protein
MIALLKRLAEAEAEILTLRMRLKNAEMMYRFATVKEPAPKNSPQRMVERN